MSGRPAGNGGAAGGGSPAGLLGPSSQETNGASANNMEHVNLAGLMSQPQDCPFESNSGLAPPSTWVGPHAVGGAGALPSFSWYGLAASSLAMAQMRAPPAGFPADVFSLPPLSSPAMRFPYYFTQPPTQPPTRPPAALQRIPDEVGSPFTPSNPTATRAVVAGDSAAAPAHRRIRVPLLRPCLPLRGLDS